MFRHLLVAVALMCACSSKHEPPPEQKSPPASPASSAPAARPPEVHLGFIPANIGARIGHSKTVMAADMRGFKQNPFLALIPAKLACARDLLQSAGVLVLAGDSSPTLYATGLAEPDTRNCLESIAPALGMTARTAEDGSFELVSGDGGASLRWENDVLVAHDLGTGPAAKSSADDKLVELVGRVPRQAPAFLVSHDSFELHTLVVWAQMDEHELTVTMSGEGTSPESATAGLRTLLGDVKQRAKAHGYAIDPAWFKDSVSGKVATIEGHIPLSAFKAK
jgi:hypothetical protein